MIAAFGAAVVLPAVAIVQSDSAFREDVEEEGRAASLVAGMRLAGYVEVQDVAIEYHWADGQYERLAELTSDLIRRDQMRQPGARSDLCWRRLARLQRSAGDARFFLRVIRE
jgi:hypothetical protein